MERKVMWKHFDVMVLIVPTNTTNKKQEIMFEACKKAKNINPKLFVCIIDIEASESAVFRYILFIIFTHIRICIYIYIYIELNVLDMVQIW